MTLLFSGRSRLDAVLYTRQRSNGTPFAVGLATDAEGRQHTVLAPGEDLDLDHFRLLEGQIIALRPTENGLRVRPIPEQPPEAQEHLLAMLERGEGQVASTTPIRHIRSSPNEEENRLPTTDGGHGEILFNLTELATTVAQKSAELGLPTAMWVHLPQG